MGPFGRVTILDVCLACHYHSSSPHPTNHPYVLTCGIKLYVSKIVGNSAGKPLKSTSIELSCITTDCGELRRRGTMHFLKYTALNISNQYF